MKKFLVSALAAAALFGTANAKIFGGFTSYGN